MNWRRGLHRLWGVLSAIWVVALIAVFADPTMRWRSEDSPALPTPAMATAVIILPPLAIYAAAWVPVWIGRGFTNKR